MHHLLTRTLRRFASIDTDRTGTITAMELQRALALGGLQFSLMACAQVRCQAAQAPSHVWLSR